jgi:hypothetical protein
MCARVNIASVPPAIVTSYCFKLMTMIMLIVSAPKLLVKPHVVNGLLYYNKDVMHNTVWHFRVCLLFVFLFPFSSYVPTVWPASCGYLNFGFVTWK